MFKTSTLNPSQKSAELENYCNKNNIPCERLDHDNLSITINNKPLLFHKLNGPSWTVSHKNVCDYKHLTKRFLLANGLNTPAYFIFDPNSYNPCDVEKFILDKEKVVIKPINFSRGRGVVTNIVNISQFISIVDTLRSLNKWLMCEQQFEGEDYRFFIVDKQVVSVTKREAANVVGDGTHTIQQLIDIKNNLRRKNPYLKNHLIPTDLKELEAIKNLFALNIVLEKGRKMYLRNVSNLSSGGDSIDYTDNCLQFYKDVAIKAISSIPGLVYAGVDLLVKDIVSKAYLDGYTVTEVETSPAVLSMYPLIGQPRDMVGPIIEYYKNSFKN